MAGDLVTWGDVGEVLREVRRQGLAGAARRLHLGRGKATEAAWNRAGLPAKNFDAIGSVQRRIALAATGSPDDTIVGYISRAFLRQREPLVALSVGSGHGRIEVAWAKAGRYGRLLGIDVAEAAVRDANEHARSQGLSQLCFRVADANRGSLGTELYDVVFTWHSLHHLFPMRDAVQRIWECLKPGGLLVIYEYVGARRFQWPDRQVREANDLLGHIPKRLRKRYGLSSYKTRVHRPGLLRMRLGDPSEAIESDRIIPEIESHFHPVETKELPGTLLQLVFHDIGHNFRSGDPEAEAVVAMCVEHERQLHQSGVLACDYVLGVFRK